MQVDVISNRRRPESALPKRVGELKEFVGRRDRAPVPEHGVPHPEKYEYIAGLAWSVTKVPQVNCPEHPVLQTTPAGLLTIVPLPVPVGVTVRVSSPVGWPERTGQTKPSNDLA